MNGVASPSKTPLLFLCHRIPYPPNKGDKIRSFHLLHHLSQHFDIYMATFVDDQADWPYVPEVEKFCRDCLFVEQKPWQAKLRSLQGFVTGEALSIPFYASARMQQWVSNTVRRHEIRHVMVFSSSMAQYVLDTSHEFKRKVVDFVDVDSDKWQQYAQQQTWPMSTIYRREAQRLLGYEARLAREFDAGLFVSSAEADLFKALSPTTADKIGFYNNGVNTNYFVPSPDYANPYPAGIRPIVFTGAMDYWPNIDAVVWFSEKVFPTLQKIHPAAEFFIVGSNPSKTVLQLAKLQGVTVTGRVEDIRPYMQHAVAAIAPMRIARGVQNKVLESMAMAKPVVVSSKGLEGIDASHAQHVLIADSVDEYVAVLEKLLTGDYAGMGFNAKQYVTQNFNWDNNLPEVVLLLGQQMEPPLADRTVCNG